MQATRPQIYALLDAFESDIRSHLEKHIMPYVDELEILGADLEKCTTIRSMESNQGPSVPLVYYLDLRPAYDRLNTYRHLLPAELANEVRELTPQLDVIVGVRRRVMHPRPFASDDQERVLSSFHMFSRRWWVNLHNVTKHLEQNSNWTPKSITLSREAERVSHNLPLPDYDDTGLRGRDELCARIETALVSGREGVITLVGEGGIGKTAIALQVAYRLLDEEAESFDRILWVTLKTERLTGTGVKLLNGGVVSILGATEEIGRELSNDFHGGVAALAKSLEGIATLICIDNLETVNGDDFLELYEAMPASVRFLVTSRRGIGQVERRIAVGPLDEVASLQILNRLIKDRAVPTLKTISGDGRKKIVSKLRNSPLGIRWFILATEAGRSPQDLMADQGELLEFCVRSVFEGISRGAQVALIALHALRRPATVDDLVLLMDAEYDDVSSAIHELTTSSLVVSVWRTDKGMRVEIEPSETALAFMSLNALDDPVRIQITSAETRFRIDEERRASESRARSLAPIVVRSSDASDAAAAQILRRALLLSQSGDFPAAISRAQEARKLNPEYWEVFRVLAFIHASSESKSQATPLYLEAYSLADTEEHRAVVAHFLAGHLARNEHDLPEALKYAREANEVIGTPETALPLGNYLTWSGDYAGAVRYLDEAAVGASGKQRLIATTARIESYRRWSDWTRSEEKNPLEAFNRAMLGCGIAVSALRDGIRDSRLIESGADAFVEASRGLSEASSAGISIPYSDQYVGWFTAVVQMFAASPNHEQLERGLSVAFQTSQRKDISECLDMLSAARGGLGGSMSKPSGSGSRGVGAVHSFIDGNYGFIDCATSAERLFFHRSDVEPEQISDLLQPGMLVSFDLGLDESGRARAKAVRVTSSAQLERSFGLSDGVDTSRSIPLGRVVANVKTIIEDRGFGFVTFEGKDYFLHVSVCDPSVDFTRLVQGQEVLVLLKMSSRGRQVDSLTLP
jgi:cold shock CspA family protein/tetratricopeptide (TPR) repeat protein